VKCRDGRNFGNKGSRDHLRFDPQLLPLTHNYALDGYGIGFECRRRFVYSSSPFKRKDLLFIHGGPTVGSQVVEYRATLKRSRILGRLLVTLSS